MTGWGKAVAAACEGWSPEYASPADAVGDVHVALDCREPVGRRARVLAAGWHLREWRRRQDIQRHRSEDMVGFTPEALLWVALRDAAGAECHRVRGSDLNVQVAWCRSAEAALRTWWKTTGGGAR